MGTIAAILGILPCMWGQLHPAAAKALTSSATRGEGRNPQEWLMADKKEDYYIKKGIEKARKGDYQGAIEEFNQALRRNANSVEAYLNRANVFSIIGNQGAAISDYTQVLRFNPGLIEAYIGRASAHSALRNPAAAISDYNQALQLNPNYVEAYIGRGGAHASRGDFPAAIADLNEALRINPNSAAAYYNRGSVYATQGDRAAAIRDLQRAAQLFQQQNNENLHQATLTRINQLQQQP